VLGANAPVAVTERQNTSPWSSVVSFFLEGLALYAASYSAMPPTLLKSGSELRPAEPCVPEREGAACERNGRFSVVTSLTTPEPLVNEDQNGTEWSLLASAMSPEDILAKGCCSRIAWSQVMRKYAFVGILALVVLSSPSDSRRAIADEVNQDYSALKEALLDGKDIHTLIDLSLCRVHGTDKAGPPVRGVSRFDGYMIQADGTISFAMTHFTVRPDKTPVNEFLSYRLSANGKVEHHTIFLNGATFAVLHEAEFDCEIGKGVTFHW
jgi:hypothetical protein